MKPTIDSHCRLALLLAAASSLSISAIQAADGPDPGVNSPVAGEEAIKGSEVETPPAVVKEEPKEAAPRAKATEQMQAVLDQLTALGGKPITELSPKDARKQPSPADAVKKLMEKNDIKPDKSGKTDNVSIKLSTASVDGRVYRPDGDGPFPVILYIHGGGWVLADLDTYDSSARALSKAAHALVISTDYRHAPEHKFPAAHEDVFGAYQWTLENAGKWSGDASRVAVVGESAGGNMAVALSMMAQDKGMQMPIHQVLVYPVATTAMDSESYRQHAQAAPLNAAMMKWFFDHTLSKEEDWKNHQINLLGAKSLAGLPPATIITADIDPLRSDGELLAKKFEADGVKVDYRNYEGVTHEFFGMGAVVGTAQEAVDFAAANLKAAFADKSRPAIGQPPKASE
jgi:acetyl esterase